MNCKYAVRGKLELWEKCILGGGGGCPYGWRAVSQAQLLQRYKKQSLCPASARKGDKKRQKEAAQRKLKSAASLHTRGQCQEGDFSKEMGTVYSMHQVWLILVLLWPAFNFKIAKECFYPVSALTANLSLASGASNSSIIGEQTGKEPRAGKLLSHWCLPPSLGRLSTAGEAAHTGGEGLFHGLIWWCLYFISVACFIRIPSRALFVLHFSWWQLLFDCTCLPDKLWLGTFYLQKLCHCHE